MSEQVSSVPATIRGKMEKQTSPEGLFLSEGLTPAGRAGRRVGGGGCPRAAAVQGGLK